MLNAWMPDTPSNNILIAGGAGYVGSHTAKRLAAAGFTPVVFDNLSTGHREAVLWGPLIEGDIRDGAALAAAFAEYRPRAVMHFAACIEVGEGERDPQGFWNNNVGGTLSLLSAMRAAGVEVIVFSSTCATYGEPEAIPITEAEKQKPASAYGRTKLAAEMLIGDFARAYGMRCGLLRYFNASGADPEGRIGEEHDPETHLIPNALKAAAGLSGPMRLFGADYDTPDGTCIRDYIHVEDLAEAHLLAVSHLIKGESSLALNLGSGVGCSVRDVLKAVETVTGRPVPHEVLPRRSGDVARLVADPSAAQTLLGFRTARSDIRVIIEDAWRYHSARWLG